LAVYQERLIKKLGPNAYPFTFMFPPNAPSSVTLQPGDDDTHKPLGVEYSVKTYVADSPDDKSHKRSSVSLNIKKVHLPQTYRSKDDYPLSKTSIRVRHH
jgi:arrestin-2